MNSQLLVPDLLKVAFSTWVAFKDVLSSDVCCPLKEGRWNEQFPLPAWPGPGSLGGAQLILAG